MDGPSTLWTRIAEDSIVISTDLKVRKADGLPASGQREPDDPGAALYFTWDDQPKVIAVDTFSRIPQNIAGIAASINALRALDRYGSGLMNTALTGFAALPHLVDDPWYVVLDLHPDATASQVEESYKRLRG